MYGSKEGTAVARDLWPRTHATCPHTAAVQLYRDVRDTHRAGGRVEAISTIPYCPCVQYDRYTLVPVDLFLEGSKTQWRTRLTKGFRRKSRYVTPTPLSSSSSTLVFSTGTYNIPGTLERRMFGR